MFGNEAKLKEFGYDQLISELGNLSGAHYGEDDQPKDTTAGSVGDSENVSDGAAS